MGLHEGLQREEEAAIRVLSGLQEDLLAGLDVRERFLPRSREELGLAHASEHPGERELVTLLARFSNDVLELRERSREIIGLREHDRQIAFRAQSDRDAVHPPPERARTLNESPLESVPQEQLGPGNSSERLAEQGVIVKALRESDRSSCMCCHLLYGSPKKGRGDRETELASRPSRVVCARLGERLPVEARGGSPVQTEMVGIRESAQHFGAGRPARTALEHLLQKVSGAGGVTRQDPVFRLCLATPPAPFGANHRRQPTGTLRELDRRVRRAPKKRGPSSLVESKSGLLVRASDREREVTRALLGVRDDDREAAMDVATVRGRRMRVNRRREQRMGEVERLAGDVDNPRLARRLQTRVGVLSDRIHEQRKGGPGHCRGDEERLACRPGERGDPSGDKRVQLIRHRKRPLRLDRSSLMLNRLRKL